MHAFVRSHHKYGTEDMKMPGVNNFVGKSVKICGYSSVAFLKKDLLLLPIKHSS